MNVFTLIKEKSRQMVQSIAFIPSVVVIVFLIISAGMIYFDYSDTGEEIKAGYAWIRLNDPSTARSIVSVIAAGLISLTVFSFSMVMVVLSQAASQLSNRVIDKLIGNKLQQFVLGYYIGCIVYSLLLLSSIRDVEIGKYVPALSTYLLILFSVVAILLFVLFLHFITQSLKYSVIIMRIFNETMQNLKQSCRIREEPVTIPGREGTPIPASGSGIFESIDSERLVPLLEENDCSISLRFCRGQFVMKDFPLFDISYQKKNKNADLPEEISGHLTIVQEGTVTNNFYYGFRQLTEVAIKALSPGINDPGTAVESIRALVELLAYRMQHFPDNVVKDENGEIRIITKEKSFEEIFDSALLPLWDYGHRDRIVQSELKELLMQLQGLRHRHVISRFLTKIDDEIEKSNVQSSL